MLCPSAHPMKRLGGGNIAASGKRTSYWHCDICDRKFYVVKFKEEVLRITPVQSLDIAQVRRWLVQAALLDVKIDGHIGDATLVMAAELRQRKTGISAKPG